MVHVTVVQVSNANNLAIAQRPLHMCVTNQKHSEEEVQPQLVQGNYLHWNRNLNPGSKINLST